jgi:hypothetical protein
MTWRHSFGLAWDFGNKLPFSTSQAVVDLMWYFQSLKFCSVGVPTGLDSI